MNCGSSAGTMEKPARPRISVAHMAATTGTEGAAVADPARLAAPTRKPRRGDRGFRGSTIEQGGNAIDRLSWKHRLDPLRPPPVYDVQKLPHQVLSRTPGGSSDFRLRNMGGGLAVLTSDVHHADFYRIQRHPGIRSV